MYPRGAFTAQYQSTSEALCLEAGASVLYSVLSDWPSRQRIGISRPCASKNLRTPTGLPIGGQGSFATSSKPSAICVSLLAPSKAVPKSKSAAASPRGETIQSGNANAAIYAESCGTWMSSPRTSWSLSAETPTA